MIQLKYAYDLNKKHRSGILEGKLSSTSRKTYNVSRQDIRFSSSVEVKGKNLCFKGLKGWKNPGVSQLMMSRSKVLHGVFYKNSLKNLEKQCEIRNYMEKYCDGESMLISSLLTVPKGSWKSQGLRREKKTTYFVRRKKNIEGFVYENKKKSIGCSGVRLMNFSEDFDLPTPVFKPRYVNYM